MTERREYDFISLGGGSAGYAAARTARALGLKTAVIEGGREVGGLCILRGCMPSKTVIESANRFLTLRRAEEFGLRAENLRVVGGEILARKRRLVKEFSDYRHGQLEKGGFDFIRGNARFTGPHTLEVFPPDGAADGASAEPFLELETRAAVIATGSRTACPPIPGLDEVDYWTSDDALELSDFPRTLIVLGAGAIGLEAAHHLSGLGVSVTVIQRGGHILRDADTDVAGALEEAFAARGVRFYCGSRVTHVERDEVSGGKRVWFERAGEKLSVAADQILCALGREPNTRNLGLEHAGVQLQAKGGIALEPGQRAAGVKDGHLFAAGDACGPYEIVHLAIQQGEIAARNAARLLGKLTPGEPETMDYRLRLFALFTEPQVGMLGLTEREASGRGLAVRSAKYHFADHGKALVRGETDGFVKLIVADGDGPEFRAGEIVGAAAIGPEGSEIIHEIAVAMHFRATALDLARVPHYHPTLSEVWTYPAEELAGL